MKPKSTHQLIAEELTRLYRKGKPIRITSEVADKLMRRYARDECALFLKWINDRNEECRSDFGMFLKISILTDKQLYKLFKQENP